MVSMISTTSHRFNRTIGISAFLAFLLPIILPVMSIAQRSPARDMEIDTAMQSEIIDSVTAVLNDEYVFPDITEQLETRLRDRYRSGAYQDFTSGKAFVNALSKDLQDVSGDLHLRVYYYPDEYFDREFDQEPDEEELKQRLMADKRDNFTFRRVEILPGNVGYLKFDRFRDPKDAGPTVAATMNYLGHCDALIIDLRDNGGGEPEMVRLLMSYFFNEETHFNSLYSPRNNETLQLWTLAYVPGPRLSQCDIYVLISYDTFSAGESLAYNLKHSGRATLVGTQTPGGAHDEEFHNCRNLHIRIKVPYRRAISPFTGTNWEGVGVAPDIEAPAYQAFGVAYLNAVKGIHARTTDEKRLAELEWILPVLEANLAPVAVGEDVLESYVGVYYPIRVAYDQGILSAQDYNRRPMKLIPMSQTLFRCEWTNELRLEFHPGTDGQTDSLTAFLDDGGVFLLRRTE
jgi:hypothetical protein